MRAGVCGSEGGVVRVDAKEDESAVYEGHLGCGYMKFHCLMGLNCVTELRSCWRDLPC